MTGEVTMEFQVTEIVTIEIDSSLPTPYIRIKQNGALLQEWKLMHLTELGNRWLPWDYQRNDHL